MTDRPEASPWLRLLGGLFVSASLAFSPMALAQEESDEAAGANDDEIRLSAKTGQGIGALRQKLRELAGYEDLGEGAFTARRRHINALTRAAGHFATGRKALDETRAGELLAEELRLAQEALGEITGAVSSDDLLGRIFSEFCIGK